MRQSGRLLLTVWYDTKTVPLLSTNVDPTTATTGTVKRFFAGQKREISCPPSAVTYTNFMNGVDMANHLVSSLRVGRRSRVWHRYLFFQKLNHILVNARINMMTAYGNKKIHARSQLSFRRHLARQLIAEHSEPRHIIVPAVQGTQHIRGKLTNSRRCKVCFHVRKERHESVYGCITCGTNLCQDDVSKENFPGPTCWQIHVARQDLPS